MSQWVVRMPHTWVVGLIPALAHLCGMYSCLPDYPTSTLLCPTRRTWYSLISITQLLIVCVGNGVRILRGGPILPPGMGSDVFCDIVMGTHVIGCDVTKNL